MSFPMLVKLFLKTSDDMLSYCRKHFFRNDQLFFRNGLEYFDVEWMSIFHICCERSRSCTQLLQCSTSQNRCDDFDLILIIETKSLPKAFTYTINTPSVWPSRTGWRSCPVPGHVCSCVFLTSAFILQTYHISHKEVLLINYSFSNLRHIRPLVRIN